MWCNPVVAETQHRRSRNSKMTSSNENIFRVTGPLCGEFTGHRWIPLTKAMTRNFHVFFDLGLNKTWVNIRETVDLRRRRAHYDVIIMGIMLWLHDQPCAEVVIMLHACRLSAFTCNVNDQNSLSCCWGMNSTNVCQKEGKNYSAMHNNRSHIHKIRSGIPT